MAMELEGLKRCQTDVVNRGYNITTITTDRHISITPYIRDEWKDVVHQFDCWHIAKGMYELLVLLVSLVNLVLYF